MIATPGGVRDSDISQQGYEKPTMINQCSNYATADDYWTARADNHKITMLLPYCQYWYDQKDLTSYCKSTWEFYFAKK